MTKADSDNARALELAEARLSLSQAVARLNELELRHARVDLTELASVALELARENNELRAASTSPVPVPEAKEL